MAYGDNRTQVATDDFADNLNDWNNGWDDYGPFSIASGAAEATNTYEDAMAFYDASTFDGDQYSKVTVNGASGYTSCGPIVRAQGGTDQSCYCMSFYYNVFDLLEWTSAGSDSTIDSSSTVTDDPFVNGDTLTLEVEVSVLRGGSDWDTSDDEYFNHTDATITGGDPGIFAYDRGDGLAYTDWEGGDIGAAGGGTILPLLNQYYR